MPLATTMRRRTRSRRVDSRAGGTHRAIGLRSISSKKRSTPPDSREYWRYPRERETRPRRSIKRRQVEGADNAFGVLRMKNSSQHVVTLNNCFVFTNGLINCVDKHHHCWSKSARILKRDQFGASSYPLSPSPLHIAI